MMWNQKEVNVLSLRFPFFAKCLKYCVFIGGYNAKLCLVSKAKE